MSGLASLTAMGFPLSAAKVALEASNDNIEQAVQFLLTNNAFEEKHTTPSALPPTSKSRPAPTVVNLSDGIVDDNEDEDDDDDDDDLSRALKLSLKSEKIDNGKRQKQAARDFPVQNQSRSASNNNAAAAALSRLDGGGGGKNKLSPTARLKKDHPHVKVPKAMEKKPIDEQIKRCSGRLATHPAAVDTLIRTLSALSGDPTNQRYRKIDMKNPAFERALSGAPGAVDLLVAVGFERRGNLLILAGNVDMARIWMGKSSLEVVRGSEEYLKRKGEIVFERTVADIVEGRGGTNVEREDEERTKHLKSCPVEPGYGQVCVVKLSLGGKIVQRRFASDDVLVDVLHWCGGFGTVIFEKLVEGVWFLFDKNESPMKAIDVTTETKGWTLQRMGLWPSGNLVLMPNK